jgi:DNA repair exonuclease SbcCD ATPase subunit
MQDADPQPSVRADLLDRLKALDIDQGRGSLAELAYRRAREALEKALEEARAIRLQALDDARRAREEEAAALAGALESQRRAAEAEIEALLRRAEIEAEHIRGEATRDARQIIEAAETDAQQVLASAAHTLEESRALRDAAEQRRREIERLEEEFNEVATEIAERLGIDERPSRGWWRRLARDARGAPER